MRKEYVPAYAEHLRQLAAGQAPQRIERLPAPVVEMDRQLPEQTILMFRWEGRGWAVQLLWWAEMCRCMTLLCLRWEPSREVSLFALQRKDQLHIQA